MERIERGVLYELLVFPPDGEKRSLLLYWDKAWRAGPCEIRLESGVVTAGVVHDAAGQVVPRASVHYWEDGDPERGTIGADALGRFRIGPTRAGTLRLGATRTHLLAAPEPRPTVAVEAGHQDLVVTIQP